MSSFQAANHLGTITLIALIGSGCSEELNEPLSSGWLTPDVHVALDPDTVEVAPGDTVPLEISLEGEEGEVDSWISIGPFFPSIPRGLLLLDTANLSVSSVTDPDTLWITAADDAPEDSASVFVEIGWACDGVCESEASFFLRVLGSG